MSEDLGETRSHHGEDRRHADDRVQDNYKRGRSFKNYESVPQDNEDNDQTAVQAPDRQVLSPRALLGGGRPESVADGDASDNRSNGASDVGFEDRDKSISEARRASHGDKLGLPRVPTADDTLTTPNAKEESALLFGNAKPSGTGLAKLKVKKAEVRKPPTIEEVLGEEAITLQKLEKHILDQHPSKTIKDEDGVAKEVPFRLCDPLGSLPIPLGKYFAKDVTELSQEIGIGPTLFLMSTKAMSLFFLLITLISIPIMMLYAKGGVTKS